MYIFYLHSSYSFHHTFCGFGGSASPSNNISPDGWGCSSWVGGACISGGCAGIVVGAVLRKSPNSGLCGGRCCC